MDALRQDDIEVARRTPPEEKLRQALELMEAGLEMKRRSIRVEHAQASEEELERLFFAWLSDND